MKAKPSIRIIWAAIMTALPVLAPSGLAAVYVFPAGTVVNVKAYGAVGDGIADDTPKIQQAIRENLLNGGNRHVYLPSGTYRVSSSLVWKNAANEFCNGLTLIGENRDNTIIKLTDSCSGFASSANPKAVIFTASQKTAQGFSSWAENGEGNNAFNNHIVNLTINTGSNNPGAIGIDFLGNNIGGIRDVTILSGDGQGRAGIAMTRKFPGPSLFRNIRIEGFSNGIWTQYDQAGLVFENIVLKNQTGAGISNSDNTLAIRNLVSENSVPAIWNAVEGGSAGRGMITLLDGQLLGGGPAYPGIWNQAFLKVRNLYTAGYNSAILDLASTTLPTAVTELVSAGGGGVPVTTDPIMRLFHTSRKSLNLKIEETPEYSDSDLSHWANVVAYGAVMNDDSTADDSPGINAAMASGKSTVYFPSGEFRVNGTIQVPATVRQVIGIGGRVLTTPNGTYFIDPLHPKPMFRFANTSAAVHFENLELGYDNGNPARPGLIYIEQASQQPLVLKRLLMFVNATTAYRSSVANPGKLFIEDVTYLSHQDQGWLFSPNQKVWARQFNVEGSGTKIVNSGADLWILGMKTEPRDGGACTAIETLQGGRTELFGGFLLTPIGGNPNPDSPAFINNESSVSLNYIQHEGYSGSYYNLHVAETRHGHLSNLMQSDIFGRGLGAFMPQYVGYRKSKPNTVAKLSRLFR